MNYLIVSKVTISVTYGLIFPETFGKKQNLYFPHLFSGTWRGLSLKTIFVSVLHKHVTVCFASGEMKRDLEEDDYYSLY